MANAYLNMAMTQTLDTIIRRTKQEAQLPSDEMGIQFLGSTTSDRNQAIVEIVNRAIRDILTDFPLLGQSQNTALTMVANQRYTLLPATLRHNEIVGVYYGSSESEYYAGKPIEPTTLVDLDRMPSRLQEDTYTSEYPHLYRVSAINRETDDAALFWYPVPSTTRTLRVVFRASETPFTTAHIGQATPVAPIPDAMEELLSLRAAWRLQKRNSGGEGIPAQSLLANYEDVKDFWVRRLAITPDALVKRTWNTLGETRPALDNPVGSAMSLDFD